MSTSSKIRKHQGVKHEKKPLILENQRKLGVQCIVHAFAFFPQNQGLSLRSLGYLTLAQLPAKRSDVPCAQSWAAQSLEMCWDMLGLSLFFGFDKKLSRYFSSDFSQFFGDQEY